MIKVPMTLEEFENFDIGALLKTVEENEAAKKLQRERPWTYDIIRVLWGTQSWISIHQLCKELWALRNPTGLNMPKQFEKTVQSCLNQHTSQSTVWSGSQEDDLFYSPKGKRSGT